jgi:hypothetical protein
MASEGLRYRFGYLSVSTSHKEYQEMINLDFCANCRGFQSAKLQA